MNDLTMLEMMRRMSAEQARPRRRTRVGRYRAKGSIEPGGCTDKVYSALCKAGRPLARSEIVSQTGCAPKSVDWALYYLRNTGRVTRRNGFNGSIMVYKAVVHG